MELPPVPLSPFSVPSGSSYPGCPPQRDEDWVPDGVESKCEREREEREVRVRAAAQSLRVVQDTVESEREREKERGRGGRGREERVRAAASSRALSLPDNVDGLLVMCAPGGIEPGVLRPFWMTRERERERELACWCAPGGIEPRTLRSIR
jgi:hypothetical protein